MDKEIPWWHTDFIMIGTFLGGLLLVILGALLQIGWILPEMMYPILLKVLIISFIIRKLLIASTSIFGFAKYDWYAVRAYDVGILLGGIAGASAWILLVTLILNLIMTYVGMNLWIAASAIGLIMIYVMYNLTK